MYWIAAVGEGEGGSVCLSVCLSGPVFLAGAAGRAWQRKPGLETDKILGHGDCATPSGVSVRRLRKCDRQTPTFRRGGGCRGFSNSHRDQGTCLFRQVPCHKALASPEP